MGLSLSHDELCSLINAVVGAIPIENDAIDSTADHVRNLIVDLRWVGGTVTHIHMVRASEPEHHVGVDLGAGAQIKQRVHVDLAYIADASITVRLTDKTVRRTGVVCHLRRQGGCGYYVG